MTPTRGSGLTHRHRAALSFDVITEIWLDDRTTFDNVVDAASRGVMPAGVIADEERLFDRSKSRFATVIEVDSDLATLGAGKV